MFNKPGKEICIKTMVKDNPLKLIDSMMDRSLRIWLRPEFNAVINHNPELWQKLFWCGMLLAEHRPGIDKKYADAKDNSWLIPEIASYCELGDNKKEEPYYMSHARLSIQVLSMGIWAGLVTVKNIDGLDPILDSDLTLEKDTQAEMLGCVYQIFADDYTDGCGFFADGYFFTAGHVIEDAKNPYIVVNEKRIALAEPILIKNDNFSEGHDIAVFRILNIDSPLKLSDIGPEKDYKLICYYWMGYGKDFLQCRTTVQEEKEGNYFFADTDMKLCGGCSGCPAIKDGKVYGVLSRGKEGECLCAFLSASKIKNIL